MSYNSTSKVISRGFLYGVIIACSVIALAFLFLYGFHREYSITLPIDAQLFGTYGDFIGGVIGTFIALYSVYLLVRTLENQASTNESVKSTNESVVSANNAAIAASQMEGYLSQLQTFDSKFNSFLSSYFKAIDSYTIIVDGNKLTGRNAFEKIAESFISMDLENGNDYNRRNYAAVEEYVDFYAKERTLLSVHMRLLYLIMSVISNSFLEEEEKVNYAKLVRGQMSDAEMIIVRYNCCSEYGRKMRDYCNSYNLTKHVPLMHLLEFKKYYNAVHSYVDQRQTDNLSELIGGLEAMFIDLRKKATQMLYSDGTMSDTYTTNKRYSIRMTVNEGHRMFEIKFTKDKTVNRVGGGYRLKAAEKALDIFNEDMLIDLFSDFSNELFVISNYRHYNPHSTITKEVTRNDTSIYEFVIRIANTNSLVLSKIQFNKREGNIEEQ